MKKGLSKKQGGAASIEFAAVFVLLFLLFYTLVGYSIPLLLGASYQEVAADALREALRHPSSQTAEQDVARIIDDSWLPQGWVSVCEDYPETYLNVVGNTWSVCLRHDQPAAIMPALSILGWRIPSLPAEIRGEASILRY